MSESEDSLGRMLCADALRPNDDVFTRRSLVGATKFGIALGLFALSRHWYVAGPGGLEAVVAILLFLVPTFAAVARMCGAIIPQSAHRLLWRGGRNWR